jgi:hypothetical protein
VAVGGEGGVVGVGSEGDAGGGGEQERGDSCKSSSSPSPRNSSTSQRCFAAFRVHLAGGGEAGDVDAAGGGGGASVATGGGGVSGDAELLGPLRIDEPADNGAMEPITAVLRRCHRFRTADALKAENGDKREAVKVTSCRPAEWRIAKRALSPLSTHCS